MGNLSARLLTTTILVIAALVLAAGCSDDDAGSESAATAEAPATDATTDAGDSTSGEDGEVTDTTEAADGEPGESGASGSDAAATAPTAAQLEQLGERPSGEDGLRVAAKRARIVSQDSQFGTVLFDSNGQVVYAFQNDSNGKSACTSADCVKAWPPVLTTGAPSAGRGVTASALSTITRSDGSKQVTYHGRPLYFYEHEAPGEIKCHNVNLHGGLWWVVKPDGENAA